MVIMRNDIHYFDIKTAEKEMTFNLVISAHLQARAVWIHDMIKFTMNPKKTIT